MNTTKKTFLLLMTCLFFLFLSVTFSFADTTDNPEDTLENPDQLLYENIEPSDIPGDVTEPVAMDASGNDAVSDDAEDAPEMESEAAIYYTVKKGDTLWDLSQRFNNSAWKWPGMWSDNKQLTNPHRIYPGQKIKLFFRSDMDRLKELQAKAAEDTQTTESVDVVEPEETEKVMEPMEPVEISDTSDTEGKDQGDIKLPFYYYSKIGGIGFMTPKPAEFHGYIFKVKGPERLMISKGDEIYIHESNDKTLIPGAKYFCYKTFSSSEIKKKIKEGSKLTKLTRKTHKTIVETQHVMTGVIQITSKKSGYAVGTVIQSYRPISLKDHLIPYTYRSPEVTLSASVEGLSGAVISSEEGEGLFGDGTVAFIDKGEKDGVRQGQMYNIFYPEEKDSAEFIGGSDLFVPVDFASFIVLLTKETTSTVLITSAYQGVAAGDLWHYPQE